MHLTRLQRDLRRFFPDLLFYRAFPETGSPLGAILTGAQVTHLAQSAGNPIRANVARIRERDEVPGRRRETSQIPGAV